MQLSNLIHHLQQHHNTHGDLPVLINGCTIRRIDFEPEMEGEPACLDIVG